MKKYQTLNSILLLLILLFTACNDSYNSLKIQNTDTTSFRIKYVDVLYTPLTVCSERVSCDDFETRFKDILKRKRIEKKDFLLKFDSLLVNLKPDSNDGFINARILCYIHYNNNIDTMYLGSTYGNIILNKQVQIINEEVFTLLYENLYEKEIKYYNLELP